MFLSFKFVLYIILFGQSFFFGLLNLFQRQHIALGIFFTAMSLHMLLNLGFESSYLSSVPNLTHAWGLIYPPTFFLFLQQMLYQDHQIKQAQLVHFAPWLVAEIAIFAGYNVESIQWLLMPCSVFGYLAAMGWLFYRFRKQATQHQSQQIVTTLRWCFLISALYVAIVFYDLIRNIIWWLVPELSAEWMDNLLVLMLISLVNFMLVMRILKPQVFVRLPAIKELSDTTEQSISEQQTAQIKQALQEQMNEQKRYRKPNLSLTDLATAAQLNEKSLSAWINTVVGKNFSEYVNFYRVEEAKQLLLQQPKIPITTIFYDVGFNSKASFNLVFKKETGLTPSEFRKS